MKYSVYDKLDSFTRQYLETALWSSTDDKEEPLNANYTLNDLSDETIQKAIADCRDFQKQNAELLAPFDSSHAGHDFWLTRNHHGAGFWDGDYPKTTGEKLTDSSHSFGEVTLFVNDDGKVYSL